MSNDQARGELVPGGLAMVYGLRVHAEDNWKMVELFERLMPGDFVRNPRTGEIAGMKDPEDSHASWICVSDQIVSSKGHQGWALYSALNLMPINPEADPLSIDQRQECEA